jgi:riboflavin kinase
MTESNETKLHESNQTETQTKLSKKRSLILNINQPDSSIYPIYLTSKVIKGFGRGSKELNCPTANLNEEVLVNQSQLLNQNGIYFGFCKVAGYDQVFQMVMSIGFNPVYGNEFKTIVSCFFLLRFLKLILIMSVLSM